MKSGPRTRIVNIVVPAYNESENLPILIDRINSATQNMDGWQVVILVVDDGSTDSSYETLLKIRQSAKNLGWIRLSRNFGHQSAIEAGLSRSIGDAVITMDADLQHPPEQIPLMLKAFEDGADVVQMARTFPVAGPKGLFSRCFYKIFRFLSDTPIVPDAADFRLLSRRALNVLNSIPEREKFFRGLVPMLGFKQVVIHFDEHLRATGTPSFSYRKSWKMARKAILDFSTVPLRLVFWSGLGLALISFFFGLGHIVWKLISWQSVAPGFTDLITAVLFLSGCILATLGVLGHYLMLILEQVRGRPWYVIAEESMPALQENAFNQITNQSTE